MLFSENCHDFGLDPNLYQSIIIAIITKTEQDERSQNNPCYDAFKTTFLRINCLESTIVLVINHKMVYRSILTNRFRIIDPD